MQGLRANKHGSTNLGRSADIPCFWEHTLCLQQVTSMSDCCLHAQSGNCHTQSAAVSPSCTAGTTHDEHLQGRLLPALLALTNLYAMSGNLHMTPFSPYLTLTASCRHPPDPTGWPPAVALNSAGWSAHLSTHPQHQPHQRGQSAGTRHSTGKDGQERVQLQLCALSICAAWHCFVERSWVPAKRDDQAPAVSKHLQMPPSAAAPVPAPPRLPVTGTAHSAQRGRLAAGRPH